MDPLLVGALLIRAVNATLWTALMLPVLASGDQPLAYRLVALVVMVGFWLLVVGGIAALGVISGEVARYAYTAFTAAAAIVALGLLSVRPERS